jgi:HSP20 family protein
VLPVGAAEDDVNATYDRGILTVSVPLSDTVSAEKHVEVIETILVDDDETDNEQGEDALAELPQGDDQEQPTG